MTGRKWRCNVRSNVPSAGFPALLFAASILVSLAFALAVWTSAGAASAQRQLTVTASPTAVAARGGEATITVRIPTAAAGNERQIALSTDMGAFTAASGPTEIDANLTTVAAGLLGTAVQLVGDGRAGTAVVTAVVGSLVETVTVRFVGETATLRLERPTDGAKLDASLQHAVILTAADRTGVAAPSTEINLELLSAPEGATLRRSLSARSATDVLVIRTNQDGQATAVLASPAGTVRLRARSGSAELDLQFQFYGEPRALQLVPINGEAIEVDSVSEPGSIHVRLLDARGIGVPNQRITFVAQRGLGVAWGGDGESPVTDDSGTARVHLDSRGAELGMSTLSAGWAGGGRSLRDALEISVTGPPVAMYLRAEVGALSVEEYDGSGSTRYRLTAEVVDKLGQPVTGAYQVRWRPAITEARAQARPEVSVTEDGVATTIFELHHINARPQPETTQAQAWLIAKAQVNSTGRIADLLGDGLPLRTSWNRLTWIGPETRVSEAVAEIIHAVGFGAWRQTESYDWEAWFTTDANVPGAVDFLLNTGDHFWLNLRSAALLEHVERR